MSDTRRMLTTIDNPHSPFDDFPGWHLYDLSKGYNTSALMARLRAVGDGSFDDGSFDDVVERILDNDFLPIYVIVTPETFDSLINRSNKTKE